MAESARIQDIQERVRDFTGALRMAGAPDVAQRIERFASGFVEAGQVRRSVAAIQQQLQYFRSYPETLPDLPIVQVAANRLEDVCRAALAAGLIDAARPSLRAHGKRKLAVIVTALAVGALCFAVPLGLAMLGVDFGDTLQQRTTDPTRVAQGALARVAVNALVEAEEPAAARGVEFYPKQHCKAALPGGLRCRSAEPREVDGVSLPAYEVLRDGQAYGLFVMFPPGRLLGAVGSGEVLAQASWDTPEGHYELPLEAAFAGYTPERCGLIDRALDRCEPRALGPSAKHDGLPVPKLIVDVVRGNPAARAPRVEQQQAAERAAREEAEARARELAGQVGEIKAVLDDTQRMLRKGDWERLRERRDKLNELFAPLDALVVRGDGGDALPAELTRLRARFEQQSQKLQAFEDKAFETAFAAMRGEGAASSLEVVAKRLKLSPEYLEAIYAEHAEQLEARLSAAEAARRAQAEAKQNAVIQRCGPLPSRAYTEIKAYLLAMSRAARVRSELRECLTPRLDQSNCWSVVCNFDEITEGELTDHRKAHTWTFRLRQGRVTGHVERVVD